MDYSATGRIIADARNAKGFTQKQLAEIIMVSDRTISKWECGKGFPDPSLLESLSEALDITVGDIVSGKRANAGAEEEMRLRDAVRVLRDAARRRTQKIIKWVLIIAVAAILLESLIFYLRTNGDGIRNREWIEIFRENYEQQCRMFDERDVCCIEWFCGERRAVITDAAAISEVLTCVERIELGQEHRNWGPGSVKGYLMVTVDDGDLPDSTFVLSFPAFSISAAIGENEGRIYYYDSTLDGVAPQQILNEVINELVASGRAESYALGRE